jgi:hypothetical protein
MTSCEPFRRAVSRPGLPAVAILSLAFGLMISLPVLPCRGQGLDSLKCQVVDGALTVAFQLPTSALKVAGLDQALDEQGLQVESRVILEVKQKGGLGSSTVVKVMNLRNLAYSRWYDEYVMSEDAQEVLSNHSYYRALDAFRRYRDLSIINVGVLDPDATYSVTLEVHVQLKLPDPGAGKKDFEMAGFSLPWQIVELFKKKGEVLSIKLDSEKFQGQAVPEQLFE